MKKILFVLTVLAAVVACQPIPEYPTPPGYAVSVSNQPPVYCYRSIGGDQTMIDCYTTPYHRDSRRMVNYYGAPPQAYEPPPPPAIRLVAPQQSPYWVKDPEPVPRANPPGN